MTVRTLLVTSAFLLTAAPAANAQAAGRDAVDPVGTYALQVELHGMGQRADLVVRRSAQGALEGTLSIHGDEVFLDQGKLEARVLTLSAAREGGALVLTLRFTGDDKVEGTLANDQFSTSVTGSRTRG